LEALQAREKYLPAQKLCSVGTDSDIDADLII